MSVDFADQPHIPRKRDASFYFALFFFVGPIWSIVPISWGYVIHALMYWKIFSYSLSGQILFAVALCEVLFSIYHHTLVRQISGPSPNPPGSIEELLSCFNRVLQTGLALLPEDGFDEESLEDSRPGSPAETVEKLDYLDERAIDFRHRLRTWFQKVPWSHIRVEHLHAWFYWSAFNTTLPPQAQLPEYHRTLLDESVELLEKRIGCKIPSGSNPSVKPILLTVDPVNVLPRPLGWYIFVKVVNTCILKWYEFKYGLSYGRFRDLEYLIHTPPNYDRATGVDPVVFIHGLGLGIFQYHTVLTHFLDELPDIPILILLQPQISQDIFHRRFLKPMLRHEKVACLAGLLEKLGWAYSNEKATLGVTMLSHSNGSFAHAWMLKSYPELVKRSCFVDPVAFCSWEGDVCYNFIYSTCSTGFELVVRYFVGTELGTANLLQRHFDWVANTLWFEDIPNPRDPQKALFLMGGKDSIVDAERVKKYLTSHGVRNNLWYDPEGIHGQALLTGGEGITQVINWLRNSPKAK